MPRRLAVDPRKSPVQERSKAMVVALLDATQRLLVKEGYDALSTNKVAKAAGVSVGSLYQYYPSKEALVRAVLERWGAETTAQMTAMRGALADAALEQAVTVMVAVVLESARVAPKLSRVMLEQLPRIGAFDALEQFNRRFADLLVSWLELHAREVEVEDLGLAAHVVVTTVDGLCNHALTHRPELVESPRFAEHLERLIIGYLAPTRAAARFGGRTGADRGAKRATGATRAAPTRAAPKRAARRRT